MTLEELLQAALSPDQPGVPFDSPYAPPTPGLRGNWYRPAPPTFGFRGLPIEMTETSPDEFQYPKIPDPGFFARVGMGTQGMAPASGPTGLDFILGALQGAGRSALSQHDREFIEAKEKGNRVTEAARLMGTRRAERAREALARGQQAIAAGREERMASEFEKRQRAGLLESEARDKRQDKSLAAMADRQDKSLAGMMERLGKSLAARSDSEGFNMPEVAESVARGDSKLNTYPQLQRDNIIAYMAQRNMRILSEKARNTIAELGAARGVLKELRASSAKIHTGGPGLEMVGTGARNIYGAISETNLDAMAYQQGVEGFLATISRATGERGALATKDVARARQLLPKMHSSEQGAVRALDQVEAFLDEKEAETLRAHSTPATDLLKQMTKPPRAQAGAAKPGTAQKDAEILKELRGMGIEVR